MNSGAAALLDTRFDVALSKNAIDQKDDSFTILAVVWRTVSIVFSFLV